MMNMSVSYNWLSAGLIKVSAAASTLFIITIWPAALERVQTINPWYYLVIAIIFGARPFYRFWKQNKFKI